ncbi:MAG: shikimate kinase [Actinomycetes bacterium]
MVTKPVALIGPMGVGKTTIGKKLARELGIQFIDTDQLVSKMHGPIPKIFEVEGEPLFRNYEEEAVAEALKTVQVVATGGGAVLSGVTQRNLESAIVIYLSTNGLHMKSRLAKGNRPLLQNGISEWKSIYEERRPLYERLCDFEVDCSAASLSATIQAICVKLETL